MATRKKMLSRRMTVLSWVVIVVAVIGSLIYFEQISLLYVVTTLSLVALLLIVGFSDLEGVARGDEGVDARS
jgi:heme A synthase